MKWAFGMMVGAAACGRVGFDPPPPRQDATASIDGRAQGSGDAAPLCPAESPGCTACSGAISCSYASGECCACNGVQWVCTPPNDAGCPAMRPTGGDGCAMEGLSCYYGCDFDLYQCVSSIWNVLPGNIPC